MPAPEPVRAPERRVIGARALREIRAGDVVNLGIGLPEAARAAPSVRIEQGWLAVETIRERLRRVSDASGERAGGGHLFQHLGMGGHRGCRQYAVLMNVFRRIPKGDAALLVPRDKQRKLMHEGHHLFEDECACVRQGTPSRVGIARLCNAGLALAVIAKARRLQDGRRPDLRDGGMRLRA